MEIKLWTVQAVNALWSKLRSIGSVRVAGINYGYDSEPIAANKLRDATDDRIRKLAYVARTGLCVSCRTAPVHTLPNGNTTCTCLSLECIADYIFFGRNVVSEILDDGRTVV